MVSLKYKLRVSSWATLSSKLRRASADKKVVQVDASLENSHKTWSGPLTVSKNQVFPPLKKSVDLTLRSAGPVVTYIV